MKINTITIRSYRLTEAHVSTCTYQYQIPLHCTSGLIDSRLRASSILHAFTRVSMQPHTQTRSRFRVVRVNDVAAYYERGYEMVVIETDDGCNASLTLRSHEKWNFCATLKSIALNCRIPEELLWEANNNEWKNKSLNTCNYGNI